MLTLEKEVPDNTPEARQRRASIYKAYKAWQSLLYGAEKKRLTGTLSICVSVESGKVGRYRTMFAPTDQDS